MHTQYSTELTPPSAETTPSRESAVFARVAVEFFDEYALVARLGRGGMAEVFLALSEGLHEFRKLLVIKRLHAHVNEDPALAAMFLAEATLSARLHHPNVVQTNKVGVCQGQHFLVMEYLDGQPLHRVLRQLRAQRKTWPAVRLVQLASEVLAGLHYVHEVRDYDGAPLDVVHCDVSPQNVFVTYEGQVKLLDFGIAEMRGSEALTRRGLIKGKYAYMAPEQAYGDCIDRRADVWSLGVTLWEALAGQRLFRGDSDPATLRATLGADIPLLSKIVPGVPERLARIVDRALQRDPSKRHPTALAFKEALDGWVQTAGTSGHPPLSELMRSLFHDQIEERREVVRACLASLAARDRAPTRSGASSPQGLLDVPSSAGGNGTRGRKVASIAAAVTCAAALALWRGAGEHRPLAPSPAGARATAWSPSEHVREAALPVASRLAKAGSETAAERTPQPLASQGRAPRPNEAAPEAAAARASSLPRWRKNAQQKARSAALPAAEEATEPSSTTRAAPKAAAASATPLPLGRLILDSVPYAVVFEGDKKLGLTPIDVELPAATHTLLLRNPEHGLEATYRVRVEAGERVQRRIALE